MKRLLITAIALLGIAVIPGCSTQVQVSGLEGVKPNDKVDGLPFRTRERYHITLYRKDGVTYEQVDIKEQTASLANLDALYVLRVRGGVLSDGTVTAKMRSDNTLESVKVESTSKGPEAIAAVSKAIKDTSDAKTAREKVASDKDGAAESAIAADEDRKVDALDAEQAANVAIVELSELPNTATKGQKLAAEQKVAKLKLVAVQKARRGGRTVTFIDGTSS